MTLNVLMLSTLFPDMSRPNFGVFVERQARELASRPGVTLTVVAPLGIPYWPASLAEPYRTMRALPKTERWKDLTVHRPRFRTIPKVGGRANVGAMTRAVLPLVRKLHQETPFDVIDASFFFPDGPVAQRIAKKLGIPYSVKARGADIHYWGRLPATKAKVLRAGRDAAGLLAVSQMMRKSMTALGMEEDRIKVHYTGVDLDRFQPLDRTAAKAEFGVSGQVVLCVGHLIRRKGQALLIRALPALPGVTLLLAGQGEDRSRLEALADELGVSDRVGFMGSVPHEAMPRLMAAADVMALPSASEGLANAWVEALACGCPIVISDVGGAQELLGGHPQAGRIVERSAKAFAMAIWELLQDPPDPAAVRAAALPFTWTANGDLLLAHLREISGKEAA